MKNYSSALSLLLFFWGSIEARAVEGYDRQVARNHEETLQSVIEFVALSRGFSCSGALIADHVLLTARHCTDKLKNEDPLVLRVLGVFLPGYKVKSILRTPGGPSQGRGKNRINTDLALVQFEGLVDDQFSAIQIPYLSVATPSQMPMLSQTVLVTGYGETSVDQEMTQGMTGKLHAGLNRLVSNEERKIVQARLKEIKTPLDDSLYLLGSRKEKLTTEGNVGVIPGEPSYGVMFPADPSALILNGDSGAPLIAFDEHQKPFIIGVASRTVSGYIQTDILFQIRDEYGNELFSIAADDRDFDFKFFRTDKKFRNHTEQAMLGGMCSLDQWLTDKAYIGQDKTVLKHFVKVTSKTRVGQSSFAPVVSALNQSFIINGLKELK